MGVPGGPGGGGSPGSVGSGAVVRRHLSLLAAVLLIAAGAAGAVSFSSFGWPPSGNILNYSGTLCGRGGGGGTATDGGSYCL